MLPNVTRSRPAVLQKMFRRNRPFFGTQLQAAPVFASGTERKRLAFSVPALSSGSRHKRTGREGDQRQRTRRMKMHRSCRPDREALHARPRQDLPAAGRCGAWLWCEPDRPAISRCNEGRMVNRVRFPSDSRHRFREGESQVPIQSGHALPKPRCATQRPVTNHVRGSRASERIIRNFPDEIEWRQQL